MRFIPKVSNKRNFPTGVKNEEKFELTMGFAQRNDKKIMILISWRWGHLSMMSAKLVLVLIYSTRTYSIHESSLITLSTFMQTQLSPLVRKSFVVAPYVEMIHTFKVQ